MTGTSKMAQPTSTRSSNKQNSFAYFNGNPTADSSRVKAAEVKQAKSHTSHATGRTQ